MAERPSPDQLLFVAVVRAQARLLSEATALVKTYGLSETQFNVLRILRGSPGGLPCHAIGDRMIHRVPDVSRLLDRLERSGFIRRERAEHDRRVVKVRIEPKGLAILAELDPPIRALHKRQFSRLSEEERGELIRLLRRIGENEGAI